MPAAGPACPSRPPSFGSAATHRRVSRGRSGLGTRYKNSSVAQDRNTAPAEGDCRRPRNRPARRRVKAPVFSLLLACARIPAVPATAGPAPSIDLGAAGCHRRARGAGRAVAASSGSPPRAASSGCPWAGVARAAASDARRLSFYSLHTEESLSTVYWQDGRLVPDALAEIDWHLRDFRTGEVHAIDPDLLDLLHRLRPGDAIRRADPRDLRLSLGEDQRHARGAKRRRCEEQLSRARHGDRPPRCRGERCATCSAPRWISPQGGVGFYPRSDFVHVDTGPVRRW